MKNMKKIGFTLIEIIGVVVVLGIISLVAFPTLLNLIKETNVKIYDANKALVFTAASQYVEQNNDDFKKIEGSIYCVTLKDLITDGVLPNSVVKKPLTKESKVRVELIDEKYQYFLDEECDTLINEDIPPIVEIKAVGDPFNELGWAKTDFYVNIEVIDDESGGHSYQWCSGINDCEPTTLVSANNGKVLISTDTEDMVVCAIGYDKAGNISDKTCSESYKLDKTSPIFNGINDLIVDKDDIVDLTLGVVVDDSLSGVEGAYSYTPMEVDTSKVIVTSIIYKAVDKAGNETAITRKIIVDTEAPAVNYTALGNKINSNGWSKEDFFVEASLIDYSGLGIKSAKWCSTTSDTCTPAANMVGNTMTPLISIESNNNRICVQATDNNDKTSEVMCSDAYKLDKTKPVAGTISVSSGTLGNNSWYITNVTLGSANGSDALSGHDSTSISTSSITSNTTGTTVTLTTADKAGNTNIATKIIKVDKDKPVITITGGSSVSTTLGSTYNDLGVQTSDAHSGISGNVTVTSNVNQNLAGTYQVTYNVSDQAGNQASAVVRTVTVNSITQYRSRTSSRSCSTCYDSCPYSCNTSATASYYCSAVELHVCKTNKCCWDSGYESAGQVYGSASVRYSCPSGYTPSGSQCLKTCYKDCNPHDCSCSTSWGSWSLWSTTVVTETSSRQVQTRQCTSWPCSTS